MLCALLLLTAPADAARVYEAPEVREARAERVLVAEVIGAEPRWGAGEHGSIETAVELYLPEALPGQAEVIEVIVPGGVIGGQWMQTSGAPVFEVGGVYRVALIRDLEGRWRVTGGEAGAALMYRVAPPPPYVLSGMSFSSEPSPIAQGFVLNAAEFSSTFGGEQAVEDTVLTMFDVWNTEAEAGFMIRYGGTTSKDRSSSDNSFTIHYDDVYYYDTGTLALATWWGSGSRTSECDIAFYGANLGGNISWDNDPGGAGNGRQDFQYVATHEMGHCLGLSHSNSRDAIMYYAAPSGAGPSERRLDSDDIAAVQYLYGAVAPELTLVSYTLTDPDGESEAGEALELLLTLRNAGDGHAYDLSASVTGGGSDLSLSAPELLENLGPGDSATVSVPAEVGGGCEGEVALSLGLTVSDLVGNTLSETLEVSLACPTSGGGDSGSGGPGGPNGSHGAYSEPLRPPEAGVTPSGCATPVAPAGLAGLLLALAAMARRRD